MPSFIDQLLFRIGGNTLRIALARKWGVRVGKDTYINPPCYFGSEPYLISIGNHCVLSGHNTFITHDGAIRIFRRNEDDFKEINTLFGLIAIRDNCFIGYNSIILPNVIIGPNSVVGAGSVVTKSVPAKCIYAGNPAKFICTYEEYLSKCKRKSTGDLPRKIRKEQLINRFKDILHG